MNIVDRPKRSHFKFGQNFAADLLLFYIIKNSDFEIASDTINDLSEEVSQAAKKLKLDF